MNSTAQLNSVFAIKDEYASSKGKGKGAKGADKGKGKGDGKAAKEDKVVKAIDDLAEESKAYHKCLLMKNLLNEKVSQLEVLEASGGDSKYYTDAIGKEIAKQMKVIKNKISAMKAMYTEKNSDLDDMKTELKECAALVRDVDSYIKDNSKIFQTESAKSKRARR